MLEPGRVRRSLRSFDLHSLFIEELGWDTYTHNLSVDVDGHTYALQAVAEKRGVVALALDASNAPAGTLPEYATRRKIERRVAQSFREHVIVYLDRQAGEQIWQWVRREPGRPLACREHRYASDQSGESLIQKLQAVAFDLEEEETLTLVDVTGRLRAAFNVEQATKRFYDSFRRERDAFEGFLQGIPDEEMARWYVSVMLNRLMFIYFIQKKGFLDGDPDYLRARLARTQARAADRFYHDLLCPLFFEGFARPESERSPETRALLGRIPYLNGGIFQRHEVEQAHGRTIQIPDAAFQRLFDFFDGYQWHLDDRPLRDDREINPDVLGYIFEKYINQKQMGAYYTQEDITGYISRNTILPFLLEKANQACPAAFRGEDSPWALLAADPDRYIYAAVRQGTELALPPEIEAGIDDVSRRGPWNARTPGEYALPTEIWRETVARRQRYERVRARLAAGEVRAADELVTLNLDIEQYALDVIENCADPDLLRAIWKTLNEMTVLDPTCGSGAFLFAALNVLEPLYEACLARMEAYLDELPADAHPKKLGDFRAVLAQVGQHPSQRYYVLKSVVINNLYGVDIMPEAVEIAKLRLFLKLVAQVDRVERIEPLPDVDFNVQAGNALVGFATYQEVERAVQSKSVGGEAVQYTMMLDDTDPMIAIEQKAQDVDRLYRHFRQQQTELGGEVTPADKRALRERLDALAHELDRYLAREYGVDAENPMDVALWRKSHQPFHWFVEFYGTMHRGGFDVVIGNPPWKEYSTVKKIYTIREYATEKCGNLYAICAERALNIRAREGCFSFIVQLPLTCSPRMNAVRNLLRRRSLCLITAPFDDRPGKLFSGLQNCRSAIFVSQGQPSTSMGSLFTTGYQRWFTDTRPQLFAGLNFVQTPNTVVYTGVFPKYADQLEVQVFDKIRSKGKQSLGIHLDRRKTTHFIFYQEAMRYWTKATIGLPYYAKNGVVGAPAHGRFLYFDHDQVAHAVCALLNSSLFYVYFIAYGDGFHLNQRLVSHFPLAPELIEDSRIAALSADLMADLRSNAEQKTIMTRDGDEISYAEFYAGKSKALLDEIDRVIAGYYGFTDEELDFILNYDIKYRMGDELFEDDDE